MSVSLKEPRSWLNCSPLNTSKHTNPTPTPINVTNSKPRKRPPITLSCAVHSLTFYQQLNGPKFYGHEDISRLSARFMTHLFGCDNLHPGAESPQAGPLPYFIAYLMHKTNYPNRVTYLALLLLQLLKASEPTYRDRKGHHLFLCAFVAAASRAGIPQHSEELWRDATQRLFSVQDMRVEDRMRPLLEQVVTAEDALSQFESRVTEDFSNDTGPYPTYDTQMFLFHGTKLAS